MALGDVWARIDQGYDDFSPRLRRAARYLRAHPQEIALQSLRTVSRQADVSPTSMTRLAHALGYDNYEMIRAQYREWLKEGRSEPFSDRAGKVMGGTGKAGGDAAVIATIAEAERANIAASLSPERYAELAEAADMIVAAPSSTILGIRSSFPIAFGLHYALALFMPQIRLVAGTGVSLLDDLHMLGAGDCFITVSVAPYSSDTINAARFAARKGASILAITDGPLSPLARMAKVALSAGNDSPSHIASPIGPMAVAHVLAQLVLTRSGATALETLRKREEALEAMQAYVSEETST